MNRRMTGILKRRLITLLFTAAMLAAARLLSLWV